MVNFQSDDWAFVKDHVENLLKDYRTFLENPDKTYKEKLIANGKIIALKLVLNLPQNAFDISAANKR